jgi:translation initiation factor IF-2
MEKEQNTNTKERAPIVVLLGHVDHGKSSLLEAIKDLKITQKESGGITQHIGAYEIDHQGKKITFIDTPGHEAFYAMRSRGAKVADIAILVVAAEEGVKSQTKEAIACIKESNIPVIVALNKIDKPQASPQKVKAGLAKEGITTEDMGGDVPCVQISATQKQGIGELLEMVLLVAEMNQFKVEINCPAEGEIIETMMDEKRGATVTLLVKKGILKLNDIIATPSSLGKVKLIEDFQGQAVESANPSQPVAILGFEESPFVGERFKVFFDTEKAREYTVKREKTGQTAEIKEGQKILNIILKTDVVGSLGAIEEMIKHLPQNDIRIKIIREEAGPITEDDISFACAGNAKIFSFCSGITAPAKKMAENKKVKIFSYNIIYELIQKIQELMKREVESEIVRKDIGRLEVLKVFRTEKGRNKQIVGGRIIDGEILKQAKIEVFRGEEKLGGGKIHELQREKKSIEGAKIGDEVGILYEGNARVQEGDTLNFYIQEQKKSEF